MLYTVGKDDNTVDKGKGDFRCFAHLCSCDSLYLLCLHVLLFYQFSVGFSQLECIFIYNILQGIVQVFIIIDHVNVHIDLYNNK